MAIVTRYQLAIRVLLLGNWGIQDMQDSGEAELQGVSI
jgi:hypothetical protein